VILQATAAGDRWFAMYSVDHAKGAELIAQEFGNADFAPPPAHELTVAATRDHEEGWRRVDDPLLRNPDTGLPFLPSETPHPLHVFKALVSADVSERKHPFCGLLVSMHGAGVYLGRMGVSSKHVVEHVPDADRPLVDRLLAYERERQEHLKSTLADDPALRELADERGIAQSYKLLEFADTLALYFQQGDPPEDWRAEEFPNVPVAADSVTDVTVRPLDEGVVTLEPYPFGSDRIELVCEGRWLTPQASDEDFARAFSDSPPVARTYAIVRDGATR
jgi:hypothetical protein